ncbi:2-polyprenyl-3-methyl-5-hydroxy-6-metoxy-1,4-benzoquinol methylase [Sphingomonas vulcanisoli]|uniref:2-polyprenyl-3-methyl-5-hydroxy-6-metoxy-1, 4-benzoquinol methylase n=1 Tax=Sphingomonas vulcanisoli TaxID=1658060 RepID=A0ABX0TME6_9SPHN|nr:methyltransferase domain-containing protein [Sphingomonas vulcanisoli]NIJ06691.1 2-polyprenyl-3-methyl-5-hydroxy-6-metoxy-1,4-benzoquinol methylase [Sphingomonas vulcanisoli]
MTSLAARSTEPEQMDGDDLSAETFAAVLADLARVNGVTRARPPTLRFVQRALRNVPIDTPITILDVGFGDGDMLRALARSLKHRPSVHLMGYDINPRSAPAARARTPADMPIDYITGDAFSLDPAQPIDLIISSLVTHHMTDAEIVAFLRWMDGRALRGWFINDLHRHPIAYHGFRALAALARWHPIVRHDGALSVARSFTQADWTRLIASAGLPSQAVRLRWRLPFRWCLERLK